MSTQDSATDALLAPLNKEIDKNFDKDKAELVKFFAHKYFRSSPRTELAKASQEEMYDLLVRAWDFTHVRRSNAPKIQFVHLTPEEGGGQASTLVYLLLNDMPFVVDSVRQSLVRMGAVVRFLNNTVMQVKRATRSNKRGGNLLDLAPRERDEYKAEALSCIQCAPLSDEQCGVIEKDIRETLKDVSAAVKDYRPICKLLSGLKERLIANRGSVPVSPEELNESLHFIDWILDHHFTFLGYEQYSIKNLKRGPVMELKEDSVLGISRYKTDINPRQPLSEIPKGTADLILKKQVCNFAKSSSRSRVHRPAYCDYILIKEFDDNGEVETEHRFTGLYTSSVYFRLALDIPIVRRKVDTVLERSGFSPSGHSIKDLTQVINVFPRDELFQITVADLLETSLEITRIQDTRTFRLFIREDSYGKFYSCLVYVPRDVYNTKARLRIQEFLKQRLDAVDVEYNIHLSESVLARLHLVLRVKHPSSKQLDIRALEEELTELVKPWDDYFREALQDDYPYLEACDYFEQFSQCFSEAYKEAYGAEEAVADIERIKEVIATEDLALDLAPIEGESGAEFRFKIFSESEQLILSSVDPILENLGMNIISEKAFKLKLDAGRVVWLHDFSLFRKSEVGQFDETTAEKFEEAFKAVWHGLCDDDSFNTLVVSAEFDWRDVVLLRALAAYLKQIQFGYGPVFVADTLSRHQSITRSLLKYFYALFDPDERSGKASISKLATSLSRAIDKVENLAEDNVLRAYLNLLQSTLRSNFFQLGKDGQPKDYVSFKFDPQNIDNIPRPRPRYEIFVYSRDVEGVHLRGGKVARGGLRWSDRTEDYRTEILGLMKAQQVKNSVIVPVGAKGGFVVKKNLPPEDRERQQEIGIACYRTFICGLLDLTDNIVNGDVLHPPQVVRRDEDDSYLVVAADKGTASFSDIANAIAADYDFWLGDGFASGGSNGYDHKAMGITARGAWVSVQRHFRELGINVQKDDFLVLGIGDMAGDVFGNGMLQSRHIRLVAAFNHRHIFIDPEPDAARSYRERERLFNKPRSSWDDYNRDLISTGGGVFERSSKSIKISKPMQERFHIDKSSLTPNQLLHHLLQAPVDLIWNGGIGTYVKATEESHSDVGDKANDAFRVNGAQLHCRVIGEGGNLGLTQLGRIEFALNGGMLMTDFIDNSAGVDTSDHEVNMKILLNRLMAADELSFEKRNRLLESMTESVASLVLDDNYSQVQAIGIASVDVADRHKEYMDLMAYLEDHAGLDRELQHLPSDEELEERAAKNEYLTRPELAVLTSYMKMYLKERLVEVDYIDDPYLESWLFAGFPKKLCQNHAEQIREHPLRREIIATQLGNALVNQFGPSFVYRMVDSTSSTVDNVVKAAVIVREIFEIDRYWTAIEDLDFKIDAAVQTDMMSRLIRLSRRVTRWLLRNRVEIGDFQQEIEYFSKGVRAFRRMLPAKLPPDFGHMFRDKLAYLADQNVPKELAQQICESEFIFPATSLVEISEDTGESLGTIVDTYYAVGEELQLNWLGKIVNQLPVQNYWQALARETLLDDLAWQQRALTCNVVNTAERGGSARSQVKTWAESRGPSLARTREMLELLRAEATPDFAMFSVVLRELMNLAQSTAALQRR